jgi:hypothetical protein
MSHLEICTSEGGFWAYFGKSGRERTLKGCSESDMLTFGSEGLTLKFVQENVSLRYQSLGEGGLDDGGWFPVLGRKLMFDVSLTYLTIFLY